MDAILMDSVVDFHFVSPSKLNENRRPSARNFMCEILALRSETYDFYFKRLCEILIGAFSFLSIVLFA